jgi:hypothetical protein
MDDGHGKTAQGTSKRGGHEHRGAAGAADVDVSRIGAIERGEAVPTMHECHALERVLPECRPRELGRLQYGNDYKVFPGFDPE